MSTRSKNPYYDEEGSGEPVAPVSPNEERVVETPTSIPVVPVAPPTIPVVTPAIPTAVPIVEPTISIPLTIPVPIVTPSKPRTPLQRPSNKETQPVNPPNGFECVEKLEPESLTSLRPREAAMPPVLAQPLVKVPKSGIAPIPFEEDETNQVQPTFNPNGTAEGKKKRRKLKGLGKGSSLIKVDMYEGGRWKILMLRWFIWFLLGIVALGGLKAIFLPSRVDLVSLSNNVAQQMNVSSFPIQAGQAWASSFAKDYLTLSPTQDRANVLGHYLPGGQDQPAWTGSFVKGSKIQTVVAGPLLVGNPVILDYSNPNRAIYTFGTQVKNAKGDTSWIYLNVTVFNDNGTLTIAGPPGFIADPSAGTGDGVFAYQQSQSAAASLGADLPAFLQAWASSDAVNLSRYVKPGASTNVTNGLLGKVAYIGFSNLKIAVADPKNPTGIRYAEVLVSWSLNGNTWTQGYRMSVFQDTDGKWYIQDINAGDFGAIKSN